MKKTGSALMVIALFAASLNLRPAITSIAPILETIRNDLHMSASAASLLTSIPVFCMGIFSPLSAKLGNRWGIERVLGWSLVFIGLGTVLRIYTSSALFLLVTAFFAGLGIATTGPLLSGFIKHHFPSKVPAIIGIYTVALTLGAALASGLSAPLQGKTHSWQAALGLWAVFALIAVPMWWFFVMRSVEKPTGVSPVQQTATLPLENKKAWLLTLSFGLMSMLFYSITAWIPPIILDMGYSKVYAGNVLTIFTGIQIPVSLFLPMLPIDVTSNAQEAATWSAMTQSVGYIIGATGPLLLGWIHDATKSFSFAVIGMVAINLVMITVQLAAVPRSAAQKERVI